MDRELHEKDFHPLKKEKIHTNNPHRFQNHALTKREGEYQKHLFLKIRLTNTFPLNVQLNKNNIKT